MCARNNIFDELSRFASGAMEAAQSAGEELHGLGRAGVEKLIAEMDLAGRDEVETLKELIAGSLEKCADLEARIAALERKESSGTQLSPHHGYEDRSDKA